MIHIRKDLKTKMFAPTRILKIAFKLLTNFCYIFTAKFVLNLIDKFYFSKKYRIILRGLYCLHFLFEFSFLFRIFLCYILFDQLQHNLSIIREYDLPIYITFTTITSGNKNMFVAGIFLHIYLLYIIHFMLFEFRKVFASEYELIHRMSDIFHPLDYMKILFNIHGRSIRTKINASFKENLLFFQNYMPFTRVPDIYKCWKYINILQICFAGITFLSGKIS